MEELLYNNINQDLQVTEETPFGNLSAISKTGGRSENQDCFGYVNTKHGLLIVVCDGMGGANGGRTASSLSVNTILEYVVKTELDNPAEIIETAIKTANKAVCSKGASDINLKGMGSTIVAVLLNDNYATIAHVGDSRVYQIRKHKIIFRTTDHSAVFELVKRKIITEEQARLSAESNVIMRAIGSSPDIDVEIDDSIPYSSNDRFILCSDGIWGTFNEKILINSFAKYSSVEECAKHLAEKVDKAGLDTGGHHDNLTALMIEMAANSQKRPSKYKKNKLLVIILSAIIIAITLILAAFWLSKSTPKDKQNEVLPQNDTSANQGVSNMEMSSINIFRLR